MAKRNYKSYNILGNELKEIISVQVLDKEYDKEKVITQKNTINQIDNPKKEIYTDKSLAEVSNCKSEIKPNRDTSFLTYKDDYRRKERSKIVRWATYLSKFIIILMLLPFIAVIGSIVFTFLGGFIAGIIGSFGIGIIIVGITSFFATQISISLIALGITSSIAFISFGAVLTILFIMMINQVKKILQKYQKLKRTGTIQEDK